MGTLRVILAISVLIAHSSPIFGIRLVEGQVAVETFFIISGFYMSLILNEKYVGVNNSYKLFITNRLLKLYPVYWIVLVLAILYCVVIGVHSNGSNWVQLQVYSDYMNKMSGSSIAYFIFSNLFMYLHDAVYFLGLDIHTGNLFFTANYHETDPAVYRFVLVPQAWTIGMEISFYLMAPFLVRKSAKLILSLVFLSLLVRFLLYNSGLRNDAWEYHFFPSELVFFLLGIISYKIYISIRGKQIPKKYLFGALFFIMSFIFLFDLIAFKGILFLYYCCFFLCLPFIFILSKRWKYDRYLGNLSYPIYMSHVLILYVVRGFEIPEIGGAGLTLLVLTLIFSTALEEVVSKPIERMRQKRLSFSA